MQAAQYVNDCACFAPVQKCVDPFKQDSDGYWRDHELLQVTAASSASLGQGIVNSMAGNEQEWIGPVPNRIAGRRSADE